jgi:hypothetical protein
MPRGAWDTRRAVHRALAPSAGPAWICEAVSLARAGPARRAGFHWHGRVTSADAPPAADDSVMRHSTFKRVQLCTNVITAAMKLRLVCAAPKLAHVLAGW